MGDGCTVEPPALIAKAGVTGEPEIPPSLGHWHVCHLHPMVSSCSHTVGGRSKQGAKGSMVRGVGGKRCDLVQQSSYFQKEKEPTPWHAVPTMGSSQEEPRQTCTRGCPEAGVHAGAQLPLWVSDPDQDGLIAGS